MTLSLREQILSLVDEFAAVALAPQPFLPGTTMVTPFGKLLDAVDLKSMVQASLDG